MTDKPLDDSQILADAYVYLMHLHGGTHPDEPAMRERWNAFFPSLHWRVQDYPKPFKAKEHAIELPPVNFKAPKP